MPARLDPLAAGVMIVCTGARLQSGIEEFSISHEELRHTGWVLLPPSYDLEHEIDATYLRNISHEGTGEKVLTHFIGEIEQVPPCLFPPVWWTAKRAYDPARKGEVSELKGETACY